MKDIIKVLAVNDPAAYAYTKESSVGITKKWEENNEEENKRNPWYKTNYEMLKRAKRVPALVEWMDISDNLYSSVHKAFTGAISPKEALVNCCIYKK
ncbi:hypothetical protein [Clostridium botulinum]|uniref:hypothetical protein n=1 Tax=Clostridium botulinum TaxID=1491 RepID=UPI000774678B|nr:hypothetical protein [Clostridium botulinum]AUN02854.1 hypothetical protein RSJ19_07970 [Clostridium botulinum]MBN3398348.1 hypothetical protein [Clostridium botulinum]MBN3414208.1 hypothetical protein [Clostridium botulinum]